MLSLDRVCFSYGKNQILKDITAEIGNGLTVILGENGSGKSTLLRIMAGHIRALGCELDGVPVSLIPPRKRAKSIAYLAQNGYISADITVEDAVLLGRYCYTGILSAYSEADRTAARTAIQRCGISHLADKSVLTLSGGELKMTLLACTLAQLEKGHLLLDEPTNDLDIHRKLKLMSIIKDISRTGCVVAVLHDLEIAANYADNIIILHNGKIYASGTPEETLTPKALAEVWHINARLERGKNGYYLDITK